MVDGNNFHFYSKFLVNIMYSKSTNPEQTPRSALFEMSHKKDSMLIWVIDGVAVVVVYFVSAFAAAFYNHIHSHIRKPRILTPLRSLRVRKERSGISTLGLRR